MARTIGGSILEILAAGAVVGIGALIIIALLSYEKVKEWFRSKRRINNPSEVNIVLKEKIRSGKFKTVGGVFNYETEEIVDGTSWESQNLDYELKKLDRVSIIRDIN